MLNSASGFQRFRSGDFARNDRFSRFHRFNEIIVFDNFGFPFFPFYYPPAYYPYSSANYGYGSNYMLNYDKDAKLVKVFGGSGDKPGQLRTPHGQWVDDRNPRHPVLLVCDRANARLQTFTLDGQPITATEPRQVVLFPAHAKTRGQVVLLPDLHARVSLLDREDRDYKPLVHLGEDPQWREKVVGSLSKGPAVRSQPKEWLPGKFVHPHDACFDKDGNIFVAEWVATGRISLLKKV